MYEYICSKAVAWNSPISLVGNLKELQNHPRTEDNLRVIKMWEEVKLQGVLTDKQKELLKNPEQEYLLMKDKKGNYQLYPYRQITKDDEKPIRAFIFQKAGRTSGQQEAKSILPQQGVSYWKPLFHKRK